MDAYNKFIKKNEDEEWGKKMSAAGKKEVIFSFHSTNTRTLNALIGYMEDIKEVIGIPRSEWTQKQNDDHKQKNVYLSEFKLIKKNKSEIYFFTQKGQLFEKLIPHAVGNAEKKFILYTMLYSYENIFQLEHEFYNKVADVYSKEEILSSLHDVISNYGKISNDKYELLKTEIFYILHFYKDIELLKDFKENKEFFIERLCESKAEDTFIANRIKPSGTYNLSSVLEDIMVLYYLNILQKENNVFKSTLEFFKTLRLDLSESFINAMKLYEAAINNDEFFNEWEKEDMIQININEELRINCGDNILFYGVPGSGKSHAIENEYKDTNKIRVVFHPDYMNTDFIGQILPKLKDDGTITYEFTSGPFTNIMKNAYMNPEKKYCLVIEEINRGNAPAIFGDIFQLLDRGTDGNSKYGITNSRLAKAIYGDENVEVKIPSNLIILATMNTADQNVFTLDTAFQRRWNMRMIENNVNEADNANITIVDTEVEWSRFNTVINDTILNSNISTLSSEDKRLGAYFITKNDLLEKDENRFAEKVIKYLWDDAFKFAKDKLFDPNKKSLEQVIIHFTKEKGNDRFNIFQQDIKDLLLRKDNSVVESEEDE